MLPGPLGGLLEGLILDAVKSALRPEVIAAAEKALKLQFCKLLREVAKQTPSELDDKLVDVVCKALGVEA